MITAVHTLVYAEDPEAARDFFRDVLGLPSVDTGGGWLIFKTGPSELGVHPRSWEDEGQAGSTDQRFDVSLMCDDLDKTVAELTGRGAELTGEVRDEGWSITARVAVPGAGVGVEWREAGQERGRSDPERATRRGWLRSRAAGPPGGSSQARVAGTLAEFTPA